MEYKLKKLVLYTSALCNLKCKYCYVVKNKYLNDVHKRLIASFNGDYYLDFLDRLSKYLDTSEIDEISMWGAEPSFGFKEVSPTLLSIIKKYPTIKSLFSSSNFAYDNIVDNLLYLIKTFNSASNDFGFIQQVSLDGPKEINDFNRGAGVTEAIINNIDRLCKEVSQIDKLSMRLYFKPTISIEQIYSICSEEKIIHYFMFFKNNLIDKINNTGKIKTNYPSISLISPGEYTQQDGIMFGEFCKLCKKIDDSNVFKNVLITPYRSRVLELNRKHPILNDNYRIRHGFCGLGMGSVGLLPDYKLCLCHRSFSSLCDNYKKDSQNYSNEFTSNKLYKMDENDKFIFGIDEAKEKLDIFRKYSQYNSSAILLSSATLIRSMASCGLILEKYKSLEGSRMAARAILDTFGQCAKDSYDVTGTISSPFTSTIKLLLNGALDYICEGTKYEF